MYHILEIQTYEDGSSAIVHNLDGKIPQASSPKEARAIFHEKMAYAERSGLPCHSVVVVDETGAILVKDFCKVEEEE